MGEKLTRTQLKNLARFGGVNPADYPAASLGTVTSGSTSFAVHKTTITNSLGSWTYLAYLASSPTNSASGLNLMPLFADATTRGFLNSSWYLLGIQAGFEVYNATGSVTTSSFDVNVQ